MKKYITLGIVITLVFSVGLISAAKPESTVNPLGGQSTVVIPAHAIEVAPGVFSLGAVIDNNRVVKGYAILDYKEGFGKPPGTPGNGPDKPDDDTSDCYAFLARGAMWKTTEPYVLDTTNNDGLTETFVSIVIANSFETWDTEVNFEIFGERDTTKDVDGADTVYPDGKNEIFFGTIEDENVIAVAIVWGIFGGPPKQREIVECDVVFDDEYTWGDAGPTSETELGDTSIMDLQNIATHEFGHGAGLDDLYESSCSEQTMYGYAEPGETKKRTLGSGDINGVYTLYK